MPLVHPCATEGCGTLTLGTFCLGCETAERERGVHDLEDALKASLGTGRKSREPSVRAEAATAPVYAAEAEGTCFRENFSGKIRRSSEPGRHVVGPQGEIGGHQDVHV
jgi:hypothetical protein